MPFSSVMSLNLGIGLGSAISIPNPEPVVNYVARLDGVSQYWQLSSGGANLTSGQSLTFDVEVANEPVNRYMFDSDSSTGRAYLILSSSNTVSYQSNRYKIFIDDVEIANGGDYPVDELRHSVRVEALDDISITTLGARFNAVNFMRGYFKGLNFPSGEIPLTNKAQGATQLATVGGVNATMINYSEDVWEEL